MLNQPTLEKLQTLRLDGMAEAFRAQADPAQRDGLAGLTFEERFALLVDQEWTWRQNRALARRLTHAKFRYRASVEDIDFRDPSGQACFFHSPPITVITSGVPSKPAIADIPYVSVTQRLKVLSHLVRALNIIEPHHVIPLGFPFAQDVVTQYNDTETCGERVAPAGLESWHPPG